MAAWIAPNRGSPRAWASAPSCGGGASSQPTLPASIFSKLSLRQFLCRPMMWKSTIRPKPPWITAKPIARRKFEAVEKAGSATAHGGTPCVDSEGCRKGGRRASHRRLQQKGQAGSAAQASRPTVPLPACAVLSRPQSTAATPSAAWVGRRRGGEAGCRGGSTSTPRPQRCAALDGTLPPSRARVRMRVLRLSARQHVRGRR